MRAGSLTQRARVAAMVAGFFDQLRGGFVVRSSVSDGFSLSQQEAGLFQVVVGEVEAHAAARSEDADFVEIVLGFLPFAGVAEVGGSGERPRGR